MEKEKTLPYITQFLQMVTTRMCLSEIYFEHNSFQSKKYVSMNCATPVLNISNQRKLFTGPEHFSSEKYSLNEMCKTDPENIKKLLNELCSAGTSSKLNILIRESCVYKMCITDPEHFPNRLLVPSY